MRPLEQMSIGERFNVTDVTLEGVTNYVGKGPKGDVVLYRHLFVCRRGNRLVYTGARQLGEAGKHYDIRATIKRFENRFNVIRVSRPIICLTGGEQIGMDL